MKQNSSVVFVVVIVVVLLFLLLSLLLSLSVVVIVVVDVVIAVVIAVDTHLNYDIVDQQKGSRNKKTASTERLAWCCVSVTAKTQSGLFM